MTSPLVHALLTTCLAAFASAHSYMVWPPADWRTPNHAWCRRGGPPRFSDDNCAGPCIANGTWSLSPTPTTTVWRRGGWARAAWNRNNHRTGFVRLSLVPVHSRMNASAHAEAAFHYTCFDSTRVPCGEVCGTDTWDYETRFQVPRVPDGEYVLGWAWFGGYARNADAATGSYHFGDYYSCANTRVQGGVSPSASTAPSPPPACMATENDVGACAVEPCAKVRMKGKLMCPRRWNLVRHDCKARPNAVVSPTHTPTPSRVTPKSIAARGTIYAMPSSEIEVESLVPLPSDDAVLLLITVEPSPSVAV